MSDVNTLSQERRQGTAKLGHGHSLERTKGHFYGVDADRSTERAGGCYPAVCVCVSVCTLPTAKGVKGRSLLSPWMLGFLTICASPRAPRVLHSDRPLSPPQRPAHYTVPVPRRPPLK